MPLVLKRQPWLEGTSELSNNLILALGRQVQYPTWMPTGKCRKFPVSPTRGVWLSRPSLGRAELVALGAAVRQRLCPWALPQIQPLTRLSCACALSVPHWSGLWPLTDVPARPHAAAWCPGMGAAPWLPWSATWKQHYALRVVDNLSERQLTVFDRTE